MRLAGATAPAAEMAESLFVEAIELARAQASKLLELRAATSLARLWQAQGKHAKANDVLYPVYSWFNEGFASADLVEAKRLLDLPEPIRPLIAGA